MTDNEKIEKLVLHLLDADTDLYAFMNLAVNEMLELTPATGVVVELVDGDEMVYRAATGTMEPFLGLRLKKTGSISGLCVEKKEVLISKDTEEDKRVDLPACRKVGVRSLVVAPLFHSKNAVGVLKIISDQPNTFGEKDVELLQQVAGRLGAMLAEKIYKEIREFW